MKITLGNTVVDLDASTEEMLDVVMGIEEQESEEGTTDDTEGTGSE